MSTSMRLKSKSLSIVVRDGALMLGETPLSLPVSEQSLCDILGAPDRIVEPKIKAPAGHKSNLFCMYDGYGMYWIRDHKSGLLESATVVFRNGPSVPVFPSCVFTGEIRFPNCTVTTASTALELEKGIEGISRLVGGTWHIYIGGMHIFFNLQASNARSSSAERRELASIDICRRRS